MGTDVVGLNRSRLMSFIPCTHLISIGFSLCRFRLTYRAYQVCLTPNELLVEKLGLDIPPTPEVILEEIGATDIRIAWKYPELQNSVHKHAVQVNGIRGELGSLLCLFTTMPKIGL